MVGILQILFRIILFVKLLFGVAIAESFPQDVETKSYRVELLAYAQPKPGEFGSIRLSKYKNFLNPPSLSSLDPEIAYVETKPPSDAIGIIADRLKDRSLAFVVHSWVVRLSKDNLRLPISGYLTVGGRVAPSTDVQDGYRIRGHVDLSQQKYINLSTNIQFEKISSGQVVMFDESVEKRHLKLSKLYYVDHEHLGFIVRVTRSNFSYPVSEEEVAQRLAELEAEMVIPDDSNFDMMMPSMMVSSSVPID